MKRANNISFTFQSLSLPHNFLAEKMILQCLIIDNSVIDSTLQTLNKQAFYFQNHQHIFEVICLMYENNLVIDILTLTNFIQNNGLISKIGGLQILAELNQNIPNLTYLEEYIQIINDKFFRRLLIRFSYNLINSTSSTNKSIQQIFEKAEIDLFNIINHSEKDDIISGVQLLNIIFVDVKKRFFNPQFLGLRSGFVDLDRLTQGFQNSDLIILAGRPSMGKTALSLNIALNVLKSSNLPVLFFTLEMPRDQIMYRLLALETDINPQKLKSGELYETDWIKLTKIFKIISKFPLFINDTPNLTIQNIRNSIKKVKFEQLKLGLVVVDYLQLLQSVNRIEKNRAQQLSQITKSLKILAREFDIPILALSQLSRNIETRVDKRPLLSDLRESGSIEQDADLVLMISQNKKFPLSTSNFQLIELIIAKHRNGPLGVVPLEFNKKRMKFMTVKNFN